MSKRNVVKSLENIETYFPSLKSFPEGSTKISFECLTPEEMKLFDYLKTFEDNIPVGLAKEAAGAIVNRVFDLYYTMLNQAFLQDNLEKYIFWVRFKAFLTSTLNILDQIRIENEYYDKIEKEYGEDWPEHLDGPNLSSVGITDFNEALKQVTSKITGTLEEKENTE